jgi:hypothetical protein
MHNIEQLEALHKQYKRKQYRPFYLALLIGVLLFSVLWMMRDEWSGLKKKTVATIQNPLIVTHKSEVDHLLENDFIYTLADGEEDSKSDLNSMMGMPHEKGDGISQKEHIRHQDKIHLEVIDASNVAAYEDIEKRFLQNRDIDDALFLARSYYKQGKYQKAEYWAFETNKLDESLEESILIFVQSKVKLNHINEAISILKNYIEKSNSQNAVELLYQLETDDL